MKHRNRTSIMRSIWVTEYEAQSRADPSKREVSELVGYYSAEQTERILNAQKREFFVDEVRHKLVPCTQSTIEFYNHSTKGRAFYEHQ